MLIGRSPDVPSSEITDERLYWNRRRFLGVAGAVAGAALFPGLTPSLPLSTNVE
ncbi:MAG: twin-arginine translocation signal domain-containing protein, partial [Gemmatimonadales bacterium]